MLLDNLYDDALLRWGPFRQTPTYYNPSGTTASNPFDANQFGTLPNQQIDPFRASNNFLPPSNVQMAQLQQQVLLQQQQQQQQQQTNAMHMFVSNGNRPNDPFGTSFSPQVLQASPMMSPLIPNHPTILASPNNPFHHNPFGNPGYL
jgi:hypothetical protein